MHFVFGTSVWKCNWWDKGRRKNPGNYAFISYVIRRCWYEKNHLNFILSHLLFSFFQNYIVHICQKSRIYVINVNSIKAG